MKDESCRNFPTGRCPSVCIGHGLGAHLCGIAGLSKEWLEELMDKDHNPASRVPGPSNSKTIDKNGDHICPGGNKGEGNTFYIN